MSSLYCTVLYCTVLYCTVLYCTVLYSTLIDFSSTNMWKIMWKSQGPVTIISIFIKQLWMVFVQFCWRTKCKNFNKGTTYIHGGTLTYLYLYKVCFVVKYLISPLWAHQKYMNKSNLQISSWTNMTWNEITTNYNGRSQTGAKIHYFPLKTSLFKLLFLSTQSPSTPIQLNFEPNVIWCKIEPSKYTKSPINL